MVVSIPTSSLSRVANMPPAPQGHERAGTGVEAALGRDLVYRIRHVAGGDTHDPAGVLSTPMALARGSVAIASAAAVRSTRRTSASTPSPSMPSTTAASVTVGSVPPRP